ncbi:unnamed protein product [Amoebophrya sp. A120]|nr:unnamed protein product [Amoebophrya sp. A120]|eukprot:GSA120T00017091001.1
MTTQRSLDALDAGQLAASAVGHFLEFGNFAPERLSSVAAMLFAPWVQVDHVFVGTVLPLVFGRSAVDVFARGVAEAGKAVLAKEMNSGGLFTDKKTLGRLDQEEGQGGVKKAEGDDMAAYAKIAAASPQVEHPATATAPTAPTSADLVQVILENIRSKTHSHTKLIPKTRREALERLCEEKQKQDVVWQNFTGKNSSRPDGGPSTSYRQAHIEAAENLLANLSALGFLLGDRAYRDKQTLPEREYSQSWKLVRGHWVLLLQTVDPDRENALLRFFLLLLFVASYWWAFDRLDFDPSKLQQNESQILRNMFVTLYGMTMTKTDEWTSKIKSTGREKVSTTFPESNEKMKADQGNRFILHFDAEKRNDFYAVFQLLRTEVARTAEQLDYTLVHNCFVKREKDLATTVAALEKEVQDRSVKAVEVLQACAAKNHEAARAGAAMFITAETGNKETGKRNHECHTSTSSGPLLPAGVRDPAQTSKQPFTAAAAASSIRLPASLLQEPSLPTTIARQLHPLLQEEIDSARRPFSPSAPLALNTRYLPASAPFSKERLEFLLNHMKKRWPVEGYTVQQLELELVPEKIPTVNDVRNMLEFLVDCDRSLQYVKNMIPGCTKITDQVRRYTKYAGPIAQLLSEQIKLRTEHNTTLTSSERFTKMREVGQKITERSAEMRQTKETVLFYRLTDQRIHESLPLVWSDAGFQRKEAHERNLGVFKQRWDGRKKLKKDNPWQYRLRVLRLRPDNSAATDLTEGFRLILVQDRKDVEDAISVFEEGATNNPGGGTTKLISGSKKNFSNSKSNFNNAGVLLATNKQPPEIHVKLDREPDNRPVKQIVVKFTGVAAQNCAQILQEDWKYWDLVYLNHTCVTDFVTADDFEQTGQHHFVASENFLEHVNHFSLREKESLQALGCDQYKIRVERRWSETTNPIDIAKPLLWRSYLEKTAQAQNLKGMADVAQSTWEDLLRNQAQLLLPWRISTVQEAEKKFVLSTKIPEKRKLLEQQLANQLSRRNEVLEMRKAGVVNDRNIITKNPFDNLDLRTPDQPLGGAFLAFVASVRSRVYEQGNLKYQELVLRHTEKQVTLRLYGRKLIEKIPTENKQKVQNTMVRIQGAKVRLETIPQTGTVRRELKLLQADGVIEFITPDRLRHSNAVAGGKMNTAAGEFLSAGAATGAEVDQNGSLANAAAAASSSSNKLQKLRAQNTVSSFAGASSVYNRSVYGTTAGALSVAAPTVVQGHHYASIADWLDALEELGYCVPNPQTSQICTTLYTKHTMLDHKLAPEADSKLFAKNKFIDANDLRTYNDTLLGDAQDQKRRNLQNPNFTEDNLKQLVFSEDQQREFANVERLRSSMRQVGAPLVRDEGKVAEVTDAHREFWAETGLVPNDFGVVAPAGGVGPRDGKTFLSTSDGGDSCSAAGGSRSSREQLDKQASYVTLRGQNLHRAQGQKEFGFDILFEKRKQEREMGLQKYEKKLEEALRQAHFQDLAAHRAEGASKNQAMSQPVTATRPAAGLLMGEGQMLKLQQGKINGKTCQRDNNQLPQVRTSENNTNANHAAPTTRKANAVTNNNASGGGTGTAMGAATSTLWKTKLPVSAPSQMMRVNQAANSQNFVGIDALQASNLKLVTAPTPVDSSPQLQDEKDTGQEGADELHREVIDLVSESSAGGNSQVEENP